MPALLVAPVADRLGRRRVFLASVAGLSAGTLLTAFARGPEEFVVAQMLPRAFAIAALAIAMVIITEWDQFRALDFDRIKTALNSSSPLLFG